MLTIKSNFGIFKNRQNELYTAEDLHLLSKNVITSDIVNFRGNISYGYTSELAKEIAKKLTIKKHKPILVINDLSLEMYDTLTNLGYTNIILAYGKWNKDATPEDNDIVYNFMKLYIENNFKEKINVIRLKEIFKMKYEVSAIIANPPYDRSLHLKILKVLADKFIFVNCDNEIISLQPVRWLQDGLANLKQNAAYHKYEISISKKINDLTIIQARDAQILFDIVLPMDLGIYRLNSIGGYDYAKISTNSILEKVMEHLKTNHLTFDENQKDGWRVRLPYMTGGKSNGSGNRKACLKNFGKLLCFYDGEKDGKKWYEYYVKNQWSKTTDEITRSVQMSSEKTANNFINQFNCNFIKYVTDMLITDVHVREEQFLWMNSIENPRTHLIGYESDWIDEDFYTVFNISVDEQEIINKRIKEFED